MDLSELPSIDSRQSTINYVAGHQYNLNSRPECEFKLPSARADSDNKLGVILHP